MDRVLQKRVVGHNNLDIRTIYFIFCRRNKIWDSPDFLRLLFASLSVFVVVILFVLFLVDLFTSNNQRLGRCVRRLGK